MTEPVTTPYDVFVSYASADRTWVWQWLVPRLKDAGLKVCIDQEFFDLGVPQVKNIERSIESSRHVLLVLSPAWMDSQWRMLEGMLTITADPAARLRKLLPLVLAPCLPPEHIANLGYADFTEEAGREGQLTRVIAAVRGELSLPDIGPQLARLGTIPGAPFLVPFPHNPDFVGRDEDLTHLHDMIAGGSSPVGIRPTVLVGLGGIGKTQLAVEYAHARRGDYSGGVYWLNAINPLVGELAHLAEQMGLASHDTPRDQAVQAVWQYLDARPEALVVFDNVVEPSTLNLPVVSGLTPANLRCRTLFTTRQRDFPRNFQPFDVRVLPELAAMRLLLRARPEALEEYHHEWGQARVLCAYLGWLPLALELAAAYLGAYSEVTVIGYLERLRVEGRLATIDDTEVTAADLPTRYHEIATLVNQDLAAQHRIAVRATLETQWRRLDDGASGLLFRAAGQFPEASWITVARLGVLTGVAAAASPGRPSPLSQALRKLHKISLIEELSGEQLRLHPLVQEFAASLGDNALRQEMVARVLQTYDDFAVLESEVAQRGIDPVIGDLRMGQRLCRDSGSDERTLSRLWDLERLLDREAYALRAWNLDTHPTLFAQQIHKSALELGAVTLAARCRDYLTALNRPHFATLWLTSNETAELVRTLGGHDAEVSGVAVTPDGRRAISASGDHTLIIWDLASGMIERILRGHAAAVVGVVVTPDGRRAISASSDHTLMIWDLASGQEERTLRGHDAEVWGVAVTPDGRRAISASRDHTLIIWDLASGMIERTLRGHEAAVVGVVVTPDGRRAISASEDGTLKIWDIASGQEECTLRVSGAEVKVMAVAVTPDGRRVISVSDSSGVPTFDVWDLASGQVERTLSSYCSNHVKEMAVTPDSRRAILPWHRSLMIWNLVSGQMERTLSSNGGIVTAVVVTLDGQRAISASRDHTLKIWDISAPLNASLASDQKKPILRGHDERLRAVAVTPDGRRAISASCDFQTYIVKTVSTVKIWDLVNHREESTLRKKDQVMGVAVVGPDGRRAISAWFFTNTLMIWDLASGRVERVLRDPDHIDARAIAVTLDGRRLISAHHRLKVWNLASGQLERTLRGHDSYVFAVAFVGPHNRQAISASEDGTLKIWNLASGQEERTLRGHDDEVWGVAVTPDGQRAISASRDHTLKVWDLASGQEERTLRGHGDWVHGVAVTPDGRRAISASRDHTLKV